MKEETAIQQYKERLHIALKAAKICVFEVDIVNQLYTSFENSEDIFGVSEEIILNDVQPFSKLSAKEYQQAVSNYFSHPDDFEVINDAFQSIFAGKATTYNARMKAGGSNFIWCKLDVTPIVVEGTTTRMIGVITDISALKEKTDELENTIKMDAFTGLYNKQYVIERIKTNLIGDKALLMLDIDNFKQINDCYGHDMGDIVLKDMAKRLKSHFPSDIIGRFGGDEFIILASTEQLARKIEGIITNSLESLTYTCSIGIALYKDYIIDFEQLFKMADLALYKAKQQKQTYLYYQEK